MNKINDWLVSNEQVERCEDCPRPNGCIHECVKEKYVHEDVAKIRDEENQ